jgi:hypothetical protein
MDPDDGEALVQVGSKRPAATSGSRSRLVAATMRKSTSCQSFSPSRPDDAILEDPQQLHLRLERRVVDLVEEDRTARSVSASRHAPARPPRTRRAHGRKLRLHQIVGDGGALIGTNRRSRRTDQA